MKISIKVSHYSSESHCSVPLYKPRREHCKGPILNLVVCFKPMSRIDRSVSFDQPSLFSSIFRRLSTSSSCTSSSVGTFQPFPSPASPGNSSHSLCLLPFVPFCSAAFKSVSKASFSLCASYSSNVPSSSSRL